MEESEKDKELLKEYRKGINDIDDQMIDLLNKRGEIVIKIGEIKKNLHLQTYQPDREKKVIERIISQSKVLKPHGIEAIWNEIMGACKDIQGSIIKVGYLGPLGTFTHQAALDFFPKAGTEFSPCKNIHEIFEKIEKEILEFGVIPIENTLQGTVRDTLDLLIEKNLSIYGEVELRIIQNLISQKNSDISKIRKIYSHPQAIAQTRTWIKSNLPNADLINTNSTAEAVHKVKEKKDDSLAAIGTEFSAQVYDLKVLSSRIEDNPSNYTRFLVISRGENPIKSHKMKSSLVFVTKHTPGALYKVLKVFADAEINLSKIESRPRRKGRWEYIFLMDFEGEKTDPKIQNAIESMKENVIWYKILGSYPIK